MRCPIRLGPVADALEKILLCSFVTLLRANSKVRHRIKDDSPAQYSDDERLALETEKLVENLTLSVDRIQRIEAKAINTIVGVGIALSILGSATAIMSGDGPLASSNMGVRVAAAAILIGGVLYLLLSGYLALRAYAIAEVYRPKLQDMAPLIPEKEAKEILLFCLDQNNRVGTLKANLLSVSFDCLRNGLVLVAALAVLIVLSSLSTSPPEGKQAFKRTMLCHPNR